MAMRGWNALRRNTREGSRRNIAAHYDLGNDFLLAVPVAGPDVLLGDLDATRPTRWKTPPSASWNASAASCS